LEFEISKHKLQPPVGGINKNNKTTVSSRCKQLQINLNNQISMTRFRQADFDRLNHHNQLTGGIEFWNLEFICDLEFGTWNLLAQSPKINAFTASTK
jgi:hypothetical protein